MEFAELITTPKLDGVTLHSPLSEPVDGTLCITGHHLILSSRKEGVQELWLLHQIIDWVERKVVFVYGYLDELKTFFFLSPKAQHAKQHFARWSARLKMQGSANHILGNKLSSRISKYCKFNRTIVKFARLSISVSVFLSANVQYFRRWLYDVSW